MRLRSHRLAQGLAQEDLAARAGVSVGAIRKLEKDGQANALTLMQTVIALGLAGELQSLFELRPQQSIAEMQRAEASKRIRAPRRKQP